MGIHIPIDNYFHLDTTIFLRYQLSEPPIIELELFPSPKGYGLGVKTIILDTGANTTLLPRSVSKQLRFNFRTHNYEKATGVGSVVVVYQNVTRLFIGIEGRDECGATNIAWGRVFPATYICSIPGIAAGIKDLVQPFGPQSLHYFTPDLDTTKSPYIWAVRSPKEKSDQRYRLEKYGGKKFSSLLIGADWIQSMKKVTLERGEIIVEPDRSVEVTMRAFR